MLTKFKCGRCGSLILVQQATNDPQVVICNNCKTKYTLKPRNMTESVMGAGLVGALTGAAIGGLPGAAIGGIIGSLIGTSGTNTTYKRDSGSRG